jgi:hypothetical protein
MEEKELGRFPVMPMDRETVILSGAIHPPPCHSGTAEIVMNIGKLIIVLTCAAVGSALCVATMSLCLAFLPFADALLIHALVAPSAFVFITRFYFKRFAYTTPLQTALVFVAVAMLVNFYLAIRGINYGLAMFASLLATWIPFLFVFTATHVTGLIMTLRPSRRLSTP